MTKGSLDIVGIGIQAIQHTTFSARSSIEEAEKVLYVVADPVSEMWIQKLNPNAESLHDCYRDGKPRIQAYMAMIERILDSVHAGQRITFVSYGHPSVFCLPTHVVSKRCREEGVNVRILPAISAEDCLFADLGIDPATNGCQSYEATDFVVRKRKFDTSSPLILWQIGVFAITTYMSNYSRPPNLSTMVKFLNKYYPLEHNVIVYEAAQYLVYDPIIQEVPLYRLSGMHVSPLSTLYIPPLRKPRIDRAMIKLLGINNSVHTRKGKVTT